MARFNNPSRTSSVSQTATGGGETVGERHSGNVVAGGIPRGDLFLWIYLPPAPKGALSFPYLSLSVKSLIATQRLVIYLRYSFTFLHVDSIFKNPLPGGMLTGIRALADYPS
jgi:hypothetical protein